MEKIKALKNDFSELSFPSYFRKHWKFLGLVVILFFMVSSYGGYNGYAALGERFETYFQEQFKTWQAEIKKEYEDSLAKRMKEIESLKGQISDLEKESIEQKGMIANLAKKKVNIKKPQTVDELTKRLKELGYDTEAILIH
ncbi:MAG: hypothetical protein KAS32_07050 [Candidatus Peribacteraceae bacterium]|nr:hypothetical protein [Candidatus Peribacteraceae bacterium]